MLELIDVDAGYGSTPVLSGLHLRVDDGEVVALLGRNGAGKTTTLRVASGMLRPRAGTVRVAGTPMEGRTPETFARSGVAHVPEGRGVFGRFTVRQNLRVGAYTRRLRRRSTSHEIATVAEVFPLLAERLHQPAGSLSGGEQQMLVIARALMARPRILLVDEPSLGLAPIVIDELYELLARLKRERTTVLLVEQYAERALEIADRAYVLEKGRVVLSGSARELASDTQLVDTYMAGRTVAGTQEVGR